MQIYYSTPWQTGDIGQGINQFCEMVPNDDDWICIRDGDTMFLQSDWGKHIQSIVEHNQQFSLIGCMTNRVSLPHLLHNRSISDDLDVSNHIEIARQLKKEWGDHVAPTKLWIAGYFMLFPKRTWKETKFRRKTIEFDWRFTVAVREKGGLVGIARGLYIFHQYRIGSENPTQSTGHLNESRNGYHNRRQPAN